MNECSIAGAVGSLNIDVGFDHVQTGCFRGCCCCGETGRNGERDKIPARDSAWLRSIRLAIVLIWHDGFLQGSVARICWRSTRPDVLK